MAAAKIFLCYTLWPMTYETIEELTPAQIDDLVALYRQEWWTKDRTRDDVARALAGCDVTLGLVDGEGRLVGFARALTDGVFKALIFDVIVAESCRGTGAGVRLMEEMLAHPRIAPTRHQELYCLPEMVPFYERFGFSTDVAGTALMRRA